MSRDQILRNATLRILERHGPIGTGSIVKKLQALDLTDLQPLWKLLDALRAEGVACSEGPAARQVWSLVREIEPEPEPEPRHAAKPRQRRRRPSSARPAPTRPDPTLPAMLLDLEDPADFLSPPAPAPPWPVDPAPTPISVEPTRRSGARPPRGPRTTKYKNLTRCDYPDHSMVGYMVRITWQRQRRQAFFADAAHGDRLGSLAAALDWRDQVERELGKPRTEQPINNAPPSNTGVEGVSRVTRAGLPILQVGWHEGGKMRRTSISITKHGEEEAMRMAKQLRKRDDRPRPQAAGKGRGRVKAR